MKLDSSIFFVPDQKLRSNRDKISTRIYGARALPFIPLLSEILIQPQEASQIKVGDLIAYRYAGYFRVCRILRRIYRTPLILVGKGDNQLHPFFIDPKDVIGVIEEVNKRNLATKKWKAINWFATLLSDYPSRATTWLLNRVPNNRFFLRFAPLVQPLVFYNRLVRSCSRIKTKVKHAHLKRKIQIRPYQNEDIWRVVQLWNICFPNEPMDSFHFETKIRESPWFSPQGCLLVTQGKSLIGFILASDHRYPSGEQYYPDIGFIECLGVHPDFRRQGVGSLLLARAFQYLKQKGCKQYLISHFRVSCDERGWIAPTPAVNFFGHFGFEIDRLNQEFGLPSNWRLDFAQRLEVSLQRRGITLRLAALEDYQILEKTIRNWDEPWHYPEQTNCAETDRKHVNTYLLAVHEGQIVGFCRLFLQNQMQHYDQSDWIWDVTIDRGRGSIGSLYVEPKYRSFGLGAALTAKAINLLIERGCHEIYGQTARRAIQARYRRWNLTLHGGIVVMSYL